MQEEITIGKGIEFFIHNLRKKESKEIEESSTWYNLQKFIEKKFGFASVTLIYTRDELENAMTYPISLRFKAAMESKRFEGLESYDNCKYSSDDQFHLVLSISEAMLFSGKLNDGEVTALILHEIGHDFDFTVYRHIPPLAFLAIAIDFMISLKQGGSACKCVEIYNTSREYSQNTDNYPFAMRWAVLDFLFHNIGIAKEHKLNLFPLHHQIITNDSLTSAGMQWLSAYYEMINEDDKEKNANRFAEQHGYAKELKTGDAKIEDIEFPAIKYVNCLPVLGTIYGMIALACPVIKCIDNPSMASEQVRDAMKILSKELKESKINDSTKQELIQWLYLCNKKIDKYSNTFVSDDNVRAIHASLINKLFPDNHFHYEVR